MNDIIKKIEDAQLKAEAPEFRVGDTVKVYGKIKEGNRERIQVFEGVVLKSLNAEFAYFLIDQGHNYLLWFSLVCPHGHAAALR